MAYFCDDRDERMIQSDWHFLDSYTHRVADQGTPYTSVFNWCILFSRAINEVLAESNSVNLSNHSVFISVRNLLICLKLLENYCPAVFCCLVTVADGYKIRSERVIKSGMVAIIRIPSWKLIFILQFMEFPAFNGIQNSLQYKGASHLAAIS